MSGGTQRCAYATTPEPRNDRRMNRTHSLSRLQSHIPHTMYKEYLFLRKLHIFNTYHICFHIFIVSTLKILLSLPRKI